MKVPKYWSYNSPKYQFTSQAEIITNSELKFYKAFAYNTSAKKITGEIEKITNTNTNTAKDVNSVVKDVQSIATIILKDLKEKVF